MPSIATRSKGGWSAFGVDVFPQYPAGALANRQGLDGQAGQVAGDLLLRFSGRQHGAVTYLGFAAL